MPLGDSITRGVTGSTVGGYRGTLYNLLNTAGYTNINFVGSLKDPSSPEPPYILDVDHEGHSGYETTDISANVATWLTNNPPNMVLLHIGTNDVEFEPTTRTPSDIANNANTILNDIDNQSSNIVVVLAKIILDDNDDEGINGTSALRTKEYNNNLLTMAVNRIEGGDKLIVVNMQNAINYPDSLASYPPAGNPMPGSDLYYSGTSILHPDQAGYDKLAAVWSPAITGYFSGKPTLIAPVNDTTDVYTPVTLAWGITQGGGPYRVEVSSDGSFSSSTDIYDNLGSPTSNRYVTLNNSNTTNGGFVSYHTYSWRVTDNSSGLTSDTWTFKTGTPFFIKVYLQGPYNTSTSDMSTSLNSILPDIDPYSQHESVLSIPSTDIVDWVLVQLRQGTDGATATTVTERAGFLKKNGTIVDLDGNNPINFNVDPSGNYYIVVKHRNHLAVMSSTALSPSNSSDMSSSSPFTFTNSDTYGTNAMVAFTDGNFGMWAGDVNGDGLLQYSGSGNDRGPILVRIGGSDITATVNGYYKEDVNMDGTVQYSGAGNDRGIILQNIGGVDITATRASQVP